MGTLNGLLDLSRQSLAAQQRAINATANNVANQNTAGYTRQVVSFSSNDVVSLSGFLQGYSAVSSSVGSQRDRVLEQRLQQQTQSAAQSSSRLGSLQAVQSLFGLTSTSGNASSTAIGSSLDGLFSSLTSLTNNPTDPATRTSVLTKAAQFATALNQAAQGLNNQRSSLNSVVSTSVQQINGLTSQVAQLNQQISQLSPNSDAGALEDQRQLAIKQLSGLLGVSQIATENNGVTLTTSTGAVLVSADKSYALSSTAIGGVVQLTTGTPPTTLSGLQGGTVGGALQARDQDIPTLQNSLDQLAYAVGTAINTQNAAGLTPSGTPGGAIFSLPSGATGAAASISVSLASGAGIATAAVGEGSSGTGNAVALSKLADATLVGGESASGFFADFIGQLGGTVSSAASQDAGQTAALSQAQTLRDSLSGVSLDEEASNLTTFQRSYEAASKVFTIVDQLMVDSMNLGQQTAVN